MTPGFAAYVRLRPDRAEPDVKSDSEDPEVQRLVALARLPLDQDLPADDDDH
jgi:hypothetical protein